jgi:hypothetical protein
MHSVAKDMDIHSLRVPLGVTAGFVLNRILFEIRRIFILALRHLIFQQ